MAEVKLERETEGEDENATKKMKLAPPVETDLDQKILQQLDYYFSDVNVVKDKFLQEEFKKNEGWVKLSVLLTFVRLQQLTKDEDRIVKAFKDYQSEVIEFDEEKKMVRRKNPMPDVAEYQKQLDSRTVHISGFPTDSDFQALRRYCSQFGEVESVAMRRYFKTRMFKGCVLVVFKSEEDAKKVVGQEVLKFKDRELRKESMEEYYKRKEEKKLERKNKRSQKKSPQGGD